MEEEFEEGEVWDMGKEKKDVSPNIKKHKEGLQSGLRKLPRSNFVGEQSRQSAPVNIPNWSKIHKRNCMDDGDDDNDDDYDDDLPPHEWLARKMARSQISSSSVCEGAGRTLKGRDQRKVRETVLTRTGFLE